MTSSAVFKEAIRLLRPFWPQVVLATLLGAASGIVSSWLLATINEGLHSTKGVDANLLLRFALFGAIQIAGIAGAGTINSIVGQNVIAALRKDLAFRISNAPLPTIESMKTPRLMAVLTNDVDTVSAFTFNVSGYAIAAATLLGGLIYLFTLSLFVALVSVGSLVLGAVLSHVTKKRWHAYYDGVRDATDDLLKQYDAITNGAKELRIDRRRRGHVCANLLAAAADKIAALKRKAMRLFWTADAGNSAVLIVAIGLLLASRAWSGTSTDVGGAVLVLLYLSAPMRQLIGALPVFDQAKISLGRIAALSTELTEAATGPSSAPVPIIAEQTPTTIQLVGVEYDFPSAPSVTGFHLGPIDMTIEPGTITMIIGENGAGKTTLLKLLLGLYPPSRGTITYAGQAITAANRDAYRQMFATVFADFYLFTDLLGGDTNGSEEMLRRLDLAHKVTIDDNRLSTTDLSSGQRKRLALLQASLSGRPFIVTDEWAADQDPAFRRVFYRELLPDFKAQGRTLVIISHDDRYFDVADRIWRMENGRMMAERSDQAARNVETAS